MAGSSVRGALQRRNAQMPTNIDGYDPGGGRLRAAQLIYTTYTTRCCIKEQRASEAAPWEAQRRTATIRDVIGGVVRGTKREIEPAQWGEEVADGRGCLGEALHSTHIKGQLQAW